MKNKPKSIDNIVKMSHWNQNDISDSLILGGVGVAAFTQEVGIGIAILGVLLKGHYYYKTKTKKGINQGPFIKKEEIKFESAYPKDDGHYSHDNNINPN